LRGEGKAVFFTLRSRASSAVASFACHLSIRRLQFATKTKVIRKPFSVNRTENVPRLHPIREKMRPQDIAIVEGATLRRRKSFNGKFPDLIITFARYVTLRTGRDLAASSSLQDKVTQQVVMCIAPRVQQAEMARSKLVRPEISTPATIIFAVANKRTSTPERDTKQR